MVLYYGLLALETANNTVAAAAASSSSVAASTTTTSTRNTSRDASEQIIHFRKQKKSLSVNGKMPSSSLSSSNSWIYTEDLRKRFEERYLDYRYVLVPVYIDKKSSRHSYSTATIVPQKLNRENSWIYSRPMRDHLFYSLSKISLPVTTNISSSSSSTCCVTNRGFMRDELPTKKDSKIKFFKRSSSARDKTITHLSLSSLPRRQFASSTSSFSTATNLVKYRTSDVVEEEDDDAAQDENHSAPLIKNDSTVSSAVPSSRSIIGASQTDNNSTVNRTTTKTLPSSISALSNTNTSIKIKNLNQNKLTRLRSFFFKSSSPSSSLSRTQQKKPDSPLSTSS